MLLEISKGLTGLLVPSNLVLAMGLLGLLLLQTRFVILGRRLLVTGYLVLAIVGLSPLAFVLTLPLEERFPRADLSNGPPHGIIALGGAIDGRISQARGEISLTGAAERVAAVADLARQYPNATIIFSGGSGEPYPAEASLAAQLLESFGIARQRIVVEDRSLSTAENAGFTKDLINVRPGERWLLVTSAMHMPRAIGAFRQVGLQVEAYPVDWQTVGAWDLLSFFGPPFVRFTLCDAAVHEWIGLLVYRLQGRTSALFPRP
jgi:uncharacterized SAM-binding protein YcdF (DUF218 family)